MYNFIFPFLSLGILAVVITLATYVFTLGFIILMMIDSLKNGKILWFVGIVLFPLVGAVVYYFTEKKHDYAKVDERGEHYGHNHA